MRVRSKQRTIDTGSDKEEHAVKRIEASSLFKTSEEKKSK